MGRSEGKQAGLCSEIQKHFQVVYRNSRIRIQLCCSRSDAPSGRQSSYFTFSRSAGLARFLSSFNSFSVRTEFQHVARSQIRSPFAVRPMKVRARHACYERSVVAFSAAHGSQSRKLLRCCERGSRLTFGTQFRVGIFAEKNLALWGIRRYSQHRSPPFSWLLSPILFG